MGDEEGTLFFETSHEFSLLQELVDEKIGTTVDDVLRHVNDGAEAWILGGQSPNVWHLFLSVLELAQRLEQGKQGVLVEFMSKLQKQGTLKQPDTGRPLEDEGGVYWSDLPHWGYTESEETDQCGAVGNERTSSPSCIDTAAVPLLPFTASHCVASLKNFTERKASTDPTMSSTHRLRFANLNAFYAQLTEATWADICAERTKPATWYHGDTPYPSPPVAENIVTPIDMSLRAIQAMHALEYDSGLPLSTQATTAAVWAACEWFVHASDRLWAHVRAGLTYGNECNPGRGKKYVGKGWRGFERDRWDIWQAKLVELEEACVDVESKARLQKALANMRRVRDD